MNARIRLGGSVLVGGSVAGLMILPLLTDCSPKKTPRVEIVRPVKTMVVAAGGEPQVRFFSGRVGALRRAELAFPVSGVLVSLPVKEGQHVAKDEVIAQLRTEEFEARLKALLGQLDQSRAVLRSLEAGERPEEQQRREAALRAAEARLANARTESERATRLSQARALPRVEADRAQTAYQVAQEEEKAARQKLELGTVGREEDIEARRGEVRGLEGRVVEAKLQLDDCTLRAPYDGVVAQRLVEERQNIRAMEPVVRFQDVEELEIAVDVPESVMVADIRTADILQMVAEISGAPRVQFPVTIREIAQEADPTTQTFRVRAAMKAPENIQILPGMTATVTVTFRRSGVLGDRLLVPVSAVMTPAGGGPVAWVVRPDQTVAPRPVKVGVVTGDRIEIVDGLQPGDRIVVAGLTQLREGQKVRDLGDALGGGSL